MAYRPTRTLPLPGRGRRDLPNRFWHVADLEARAARRTVASRHLSDPPGGRRDPSPSRGAIGSEAPDASLRASRLGSAGDRLTSARLLDGIAGGVIDAHEERRRLSDASESRAPAGRSRLVTDPLASVRGE